MQNIKEPKIDNNWLVYRESFSTEMRAGAARKAVVEYLESIGFVQTQTKPSLQFERGTAFDGIYNPDPRFLRTEITVDLVGMGGDTVIEIVMRVNRLANIALQPHYDFWKAELHGLNNALMFGYADPLLSAYAAERAKWFAVTLIFAALMVVLILVASIVFVTSVALMSSVAL